MAVITFPYVTASGQPAVVKAERSDGGRWWHLYVDGVPASRVTAQTLEQAQSALVTRCRALGMLISPDRTSQPR